MTNSHNRATQKEGRNSERNNTSPNHQKGGGSNGGSSNARKMTFYNDNNQKAKGYFAQKQQQQQQHSSSASQNFSSSPKDTVTTTPNHVKNRHYQRNHQNGSPHGLTGGRSPPRSPISFASPAGVSTTTPNLHFAGSKYFDAPSPNALPRPPCHWTLQNGGANSTTTVESATSKRRLFTNDANQKCSLVAAEAASKNLCSDIFSHNLKLLLNVQA